VFLVSLALYRATLAPSVTLVDSGELIAAARTLGVAHPPGFPLYILLAHLATLLPAGSVAMRVNFASALFAALAASVASLVTFEAIRRRALTARRAERRPAHGKPEQKRPDDLTECRPASLVAMSLTSGLLLAFSRTLWAYATIAEVYTLNALLILVFVLLIFRWRSESGRGSLIPSRRQGLLYAAAFVFGLALGVHHVTVGLMLPALAALILATEGISFFKSRRAAYCALAALAGLGIYAYLPIAASRSPLMNWGDPRTAERLWWHITGKQYRVFFSYSSQTVAAQLGYFIRLAAREFGPWWLLLGGPALAIAGMARLLRRDRAVFWFLALVISANLIYGLGYGIAEDKDAYYLPSFMAMSLAAGFGIGWVVEKLGSWHRSLAAARVVSAAVTLPALLAALAANLPYNNRSRDFIAADYVQNIFSTMEPRAMLLTGDWQVYSPMLYIHQLLRQRDDAVVIDINQLRRSWYYGYLARAYPSTIARSREKVDAFLEDLRHWEHDPGLYERDSTLNRRIDSRFYGMILALVTSHFKSAAVYVTSDIAANRKGTDLELTRSLASAYQFVPQGLIFQLARKGVFQRPSDHELVTRGLTGGGMKFEEDDVVRVKVLPVYVMMAYSRGRYLAAYGRHEQAIEAFKRALALDPGFSLAQQAIDESLGAMRTATPNNQD